MLYDLLIDVTKTLSLYTSSTIDYVIRASHIRISYTPFFKRSHILHYFGYYLLVEVFSVTRLNKLRLSCGHHLVRESNK
jgi:hypothetical protein